MRELTTAQVGTSFWVIPLVPLIILILAIFFVSFSVQYFMSKFEIRRKDDDDKEKPKKEEQKKE